MNKDKEYILYLIEENKQLKKTHDKAVKGFCVLRSIVIESYDNAKSSNARKPFEFIVNEFARRVKDGEEGNG